MLSWRREEVGGNNTKSLGVGEVDKVHKFSDVAAEGPEQRIRRRETKRHCGFP